MKITAQVLFDKEQNADLPVFFNLHRRPGKVAGAGGRFMKSKILYNGL